MSSVYQVKILQTGEQFPCHSDQFVLDALKFSGSQTVVSGCHGGGCGICKMQVFEGNYNKVKKMSRAHISEEEENKNIILLCCIKPTSDLVLTLIHVTHTMIGGVQHGT